jgi:hypothetical protein
MPWTRLPAALVALLPMAAVAQQPPACAPLPAIEAELAREYGVARVAAAADQRGFVLAIYATADGKTWTAIRVMADGSGCLLGSGSNWRALSPAAAGRPS